MRISIVDKSYIQIDCDEESMVVDLGFYSTTGMVINDALFVEINDYFARMDDRTRREIFECYREINDYIRTAARSDQIELPLRDLVAEIYQYLDWSQLRSYVRSQRKITYPDNVKDSYDSEEQSRDKTYLRADYFDLAVFAIWLRPMVPIWAAYVQLVEQETGAARKEYQAFRLLANTDVMYSPVMERLTTYIESMDKFDSLDKITTVAITGSLSSAETLTWLLYTTVVRRVSCGQIDADEPKGHLVSSIFTYLTYLINGYEGKFGEVIKPKLNPTTSDGDDKPVIDRIRSSQRESLGDMAVYSVYLSRSKWVVEDIDKTCPPEFAEMYLKGNVRKVEEFQRYIAQFVLSPVMSPFALYDLVSRRTSQQHTDKFRPYTEVVRNPLHDAVLITRVMLWHWGFPVLSLLMTAVRIPTDEFIGLDNTDRVQKPTVATLMEKYPHQINKVANDRQRNAPYVAVAKLVKLIGQSNWDVDYPEEMADQVKPYLDAGGRLRLPSDIAEQLAQVLLKLLDIKKIISGE